MHIFTGSFPSTCGDDGEEQLGVEATLPSGSSKNTSPIPSPCPLVMALGSDRLSSGKERGEMVRYVVHTRHLPLYMTWTIVINIIFFFGFHLPLFKKR